MKITVQINNEPVEITLTDEQLAQIEVQKRSKKFKWDYNSTSYIIQQINYTITIPNLRGIEHGRYRKTKEAAEQSLARNKRANRLEALAEQLGGLREWIECEDNYYISRFQDDYILQKEDYYTFNPEKVYMTEKCAIEICRMLNEGKFSLDGELE